MWRHPSVKSTSPRHDRLDQLRVVLHGVLEIGVLDQDDAAGRVLEPLAHGGALPPRGVLEDEADPGIGGVPRDDVPRAVGRVALDHDELDLDVGDVDGQDAIDRGANGLHLVVGRHDHAQSKRPRGRLREE